MSAETFYEVLGVSESASSQAIRAAWERLSSRPYYADAETRERYAEIKTAYATLADAEKRAAYDRERRIARSAALKKNRKVVPAIAGVFAIVMSTYLYSTTRPDASVFVAKSEMAEPGRAAATSEAAVGAHIELKFKARSNGGPARSAEPLALKLEKELPLMEMARASRARVPTDRQH
jgi:DnaJ-class molecular chaperone